MAASLEAAGETRAVWAFEPVDVPFLSEWQVLDVELWGRSCVPPDRPTPVGLGDGGSVITAVCP